ncbi:uncharacterized protein LOC116017576 [Ipomoea triloba]|uniref:uncharacterized protein LOC116017576 n=1 Tax=Ipomoea triloba TaxID=35885 RepID=UPI00125DD5D8|nr:uncharacterized protein LOC116017576 [Ipomoea triloba]
MPTESSEIRMAKRELSSTLKNLKFMQRAAQKEEKVKKEEDNLPDSKFPASSAPKRCVVIMEGDPHPGARKGRMSFQNFNPSIDKLNEDVPNPSQSEASATSSGRTSETNCNRENGFSQDGPENSKQDDSSTDAKGDYKRKQDDVERDVHFPNKSHKNVHGHEGPSRRSNQKFQKQPKHEKLDWGVLRPPKHQNKKH